MRIPAQITIKMRRPDGKESEGVTTDISVGGAAVTLSGESPLQMGDPLRVSFPKQTRSAEIGAHIVYKGEGEAAGAVRRDHNSRAGDAYAGALTRAPTPG